MQRMKSPEVHNMVQEFIASTCGYNGVGRTGAVQVRVYFICTCNAFGYAVAVTKPKLFSYFS